MFKKLMATGLLSLFLINTNLALAVDFPDVPSSYWAYTPINSLTNDKVIIGFSDNTFRPEGKVTREEFATMLVKALNQQSLKVSDVLQYLDMHKGMWSYDDINKINHLKLVVGYPDRTFKPDANITMTEVLIVLANTLAGFNLNQEESEKVLSIFKDGNSVKGWALPAVSKSVKNDIYVEYPDATILDPNDQATRAEVADLLYKIRKSSALLAQYRLKDKNIVNVNNEFAAVQHLNPVSMATSNIVNVRRLTARIVEGNAIETAFASDFTSKSAAVGDPVKLVLKQDLYTQEGTFLIPAGSTFEGIISVYEKAKLFNRNAKVGFNLNKLILPSGKTYDISASIASKSGLLESGYTLRNFKRDVITTAVIVGAGTAIGALAGIDGDTDECTGVGAYSSAGAGVLAAAVIPGYDISHKSGDKVYIKLLKDLELNR